MICLDCEHDQTRHAGGTGGCRKCDLGCKAFDSGADPRLVELVEDLAEPVLGKPAHSDGGIVTPDMWREAAESTSARLARVTQDRDEWSRDAREARAELNEMVARKMRMQRDLDAQLAEAREQLAEATVTARKLPAVQAELASARTELEQLRRRVPELEALLEHAEQYARDLQDHGDVAVTGDVLSRYDAQQCLTCGARYTIPAALADHPHELTPVTVTIARRAE